VKIQVLEKELVVSESIEEMFDFFADASNLEQLTPPWLKFRIESQLPVEMRVSTNIEYRLKVHGIPIKWRSLISEWNPPFSFVDEQVVGPYKLWHHRHVFEVTPSGTLVRDIVRYSAPGGYLINKFLVRPDLDKIFAYRHQKLREHFSVPTATPAR
jgi:ligand-binding SRPBCC domain-containing protein